MVHTRPPAEPLLDVLRTRGITGARDLGAALGISQPSVSRAVSMAGERAARIGRGRRTRYAAVRDVRGLGSDWPLYRIDARGRPQEFGRLTALHGGACLVTAKDALAWLRGEFAEGLFPGLPWFLDDQRPQGFLGRGFAHRWARELGLPTDIARWNDDAVLAALLLHGEDGPGDFVLGDAALEHALRNQPDPIDAASRETVYDARAQAALAGELVGSSAAGEQPKFTACVADGAGDTRHVIVKFSEPVDGNFAARRWADLLICEHLAGTLLAEHGQASAHTELVWSQGRLCLEATRFDRIGAHGRRGFCTLAAWDDAHAGQRDDWVTAARRMRASDWLDDDGLAEVQRRWWFGRLIGNTDMHFGNLGFHLDDMLPWVPAPSYDMLPMLYRPDGSGAVVMRTFDPPPPTPSALSHWRQAADWASQFWKGVAGHAAISDGFRRLAGDNGTKVDALRRRFDDGG
ncbi:MAG: type II toxin-antitoxin system HipA family toxinoxin YjjJ [Rhodanobacteraceae bacterium]|nr:MAG: type II toxin-antitoxin system HipA family toxinoxin YjjJ [Rhodanobacteraceae bacterium]